MSDKIFSVQPIHYFSTHAIVGANLLREHGVEPESIGLCWHLSNIDQPVVVGEYSTSADTSILLEMVAEDLNSQSVTIDMALNTMKDHAIDIEQFISKVGV